MVNNVILEYTIITITIIVVVVIIIIIIVVVVIIHACSLLSLLSDCSGHRKR